MPPRSEPPEPCRPALLVRTRGNRRTLEFQDGDIQSEMLLSHPDALVLDYARAMMCFALFAPSPRHILMVGLGGGSLAKFCYRHFPCTRITVLEISAEVIALRKQFCVPADDARLRIIHTDAADYIRAAPASVDVILVDGFDAAGMPEALGSARFYTDCRRALRTGGVLVANILAYDPLHDTLVARVRKAFGGGTCDFRGVAGNNHLLFALKGQPHEQGYENEHAPATAAARLQARLQKRLREYLMRHRGLGFPFLNRLLARALVAWLGRRPV